MLAIIAITITASAQFPTDEGQLKALYDLSSKFTLVKPQSGKPYAVMWYPVTNYNHFAVYGKKWDKYLGINKVIVMPDGIKKMLVNKINKFDSKLKVRVATHKELTDAINNRRYNIQSENGPYNVVTKGFYLSMDEASYMRMQELRKRYNNRGGNNGNPDANNGLFDNVDNSGHETITITSGKK